jgi:hypothetical protein
MIGLYENLINAVIKTKPEISFLAGSKSIGNLFKNRKKNPILFREFPYSKEIINSILENIKNTYCSIYSCFEIKKIQKEIKNQFEDDFRLDLSNHLGLPRIRDKASNSILANENKENLFVSFYSQVLQLVRSHCEGYSYNLSFLTGNVSVSNPSSMKFFDGFAFGSPFHIITNKYQNGLMRTVPALDEKFAIKCNEYKKHLVLRYNITKNQFLKIFNSKYKKSFDKKSTKLKHIQQLHKKDIRRLEKLLHIANSIYKAYANSDKKNNILSYQCVAMHSCLINEMLDDTKIKQVSLETSSVLSEVVIKILEDNNSLTNNILTNKRMRDLFTKELGMIPVARECILNNSLAYNLVPLKHNGKIINSFKIKDDYDGNYEPFKLAELLEKGKIILKIPFDLAIILMETGIKLEGGEDQIVYMNKIKQAVIKILKIAQEKSEFSKFNINKRIEAIKKMDFITTQFLSWGFKKNVEPISYYESVSGRIKITENILNKIADIPLNKAFAAGCLFKYYQQRTGAYPTKSMISSTKEFIKHDLLKFCNYED